MRVVNAAIGESAHSKGSVAPSSGRKGSASPEVSANTERRLLLAFIYHFSSPASTIIANLVRRVDDNCMILNEDEMLGGDPIPDVEHALVVRPRCRGG
jgi:hypothetical protein